MLYLDLETFSELDLRLVALDRYAEHPSTKIILCCYAIDDGPIMTIENPNSVKDYPAEFLEALCSL